MSSRLEENKVAVRYARALFESVSEAGPAEADRVLEDLHNVNNLFVTMPQLRQFMENPAITVAEKTSFIDQQFNQVSPWVMKITKLLVEGQRISAFSALVKQYEELINKRDNRTTAEVVSAVELDSSLLDRIAKTLQTRFGFAQVNVKNRVEPGILGGAIIKLQDKIIDGSYVGKLENMRQQVGGRA